MTQISKTDRVSARSPAGEVEVKPDPGHVLILVELTAVGTDPVTITVDQLGARGASSAAVAPVGAAPFSLSNFDAFPVSGWRTVTDAQNRAIKIGRDKEEQPIQVTVSPGANISIVYIVPQAGPPLTLALPGAGDVQLVARE